MPDPGIDFLLTFGPCPANAFLLNMSRFYQKFCTVILALLVAATAVSGSEIESRLKLELGEGDFPGGPYCMAVGADGALFVLDQGRAVLHRISPETGEMIWRIDGSESGQPFIDPAYISRPDGFFIYLTDRGSRKVWRIDYRGEIRGNIDLAFATDPVLLDLTSGSQMVLYDRAASAIHLLDDSGRPLWSFPTGAGRKTGEPADLCVSPDGSRLYLLWSDPPAVVSFNIYGRTSSSLPLPIESISPRLLAAAVLTGGGEALCLADGAGAVLVLDPLSGSVAELPATGEKIWDIRAAPDDPGTLYMLAGKQVALIKIKLETGN